MPQKIPQLDYLINAENFQRIQDCLAAASDMAMLMVDVVGRPITRHSACSAYCALVRSHPVLSERCRQCDSRGGIEATRIGKPYIYLCHMGLLDLAIPIMVQGDYAGAILAGQVVLPDTAEANSLERIASALHPDLSDDFSDHLDAARKQLPVMELDRIRTIAHMMYHVHAYIMEEALLKVRAHDSLVAVPSANLPERPPSWQAPVWNAPVLQPAFDYIEEHFGLRFGPDEMAERCNISLSYFSKLFRKVTSESFVNYVNRVRIRKACELLSTTDLSVTIIAYDLGFEDTSYFNKVFKRVTGSTPSSWRATERRSV